MGKEDDGGEGEGEEGHDGTREGGDIEWGDEMVDVRCRRMMANVSFPTHVIF